MPDETKPTSLPRIAMDFNGSSLANPWTNDDLRKQGIELRDVMRCVFYDVDEENGVRGFLHCEGSVAWDATGGHFRVGTDRTIYQFTPGNDLSVLDEIYL